MLVEIDWEKGGLNHVTLLVLDLRLGVVGAAGAGSSQYIISAISILASTIPGHASQFHR